MSIDVRKSFHDDLDQLKAKVAQLGALAQETVTAAAEAILSGDLVAATALIERDDELDELSVDIDDHCCRLLARQAPVAGDLRTIVATMRINSDLERSGDLMVNAAKGARRMYGVEIPPRLRGIIQAMSEEARRLLRLACDAYVDGNGALGDALHDMDDRLDALQVEFIETMFAANREGQLGLPASVQLALIARYFERVGDHAVNVGERVMYMADGVMPEHVGAARSEEKRRRATEADGGNGSASGPFATGP